MSRPATFGVEPEGKTGPEIGVAIGGKIVEDLSIQCAGIPIGDRGQGHRSSRLGPGSVS
jgi:hypothetical protein